MILLKKNLLLNILLTFLYALVTLIFVLHHEIWADEAQVWLLAKNLSVFELFKHLVNEGHPSFFYLLVMPFAKVFSPIFGANAIISMQLICWLASVGAVFFILQFSPFNNFLKTAIILSSGFLYFFPVIARSYSILPILIFACAILYKKIKENPKLYAIPYAIVLALCANTHVITFMFVFLLGIFFVYDSCVKEKIITKQNIIAALIIFLSLAAVVIQLLGTFSQNGSIRFDIHNLWTETTKTFSLFFLNSVGLVYKSMFDKMHVTFVAASAAITMFFIFVLLFVQLWFTQKRMAFLAFLSIGFQFFIYITSYKAMLYQTRIFSAYIILIFCFWIAFQDERFKESIKIFGKKSLNMTLGIFFLMTFFCGLHAVFLDMMFNYSSAKQTADFLERNISKEAVVFPNIDAFGLAVYAFAPDVRFFSIYKDKDIKYMQWYTPGVYPDSDFSHIVETKIKENKFKKTYILVSSVMNVQHLEKTIPDKYKLVFKSNPSIATGEAFRVYEYTEGNKK